MSLARVLDAPDPRTSALVPEGYAEKAMASLLQLHGELMEEKERRVELYRRLMEREQALAELRMYVRLLEERAAAAGVPPAPPPSWSAVGVRPPPAQPPVPPRVPGKSRAEGWRAW